MHLEPEAKNVQKNVNFQTSKQKNKKKYPDTSNTLSLFLDQFLETDLRPIYFSLTTQLESGVQTNTCSLSVITAMIIIY